MQPAGGPWGLARIRCSPLTLARLVLLLFVLSLSAATTADADLWGHVRFGLDTISSGRLPTSDPYSFTSDRPWVNHEWLAEVLMAAAYSAFGVLGLNLLKLACIALVGLILVAMARQERGTPWTRDVFLALVLFSVYTRMHPVRPQLFSVLLFAVLMYVLRQSERGAWRLAWGIPLLFAVWANLHGGWIVGLAVLFVWLTAAVLRSAERRVRLRLIGVGLASIAATFANPYGVGLWSFLGQTVRLHRAGITDWTPFLQLPGAVIAIETLLPTLAVLSIARSRSRVPLRDGAIVAMLIFATLRVGRTDAFAQTAIAFLFVLPIVDGLNTFERRLLSVRATFGRRSPVVAAVAMCLVAFTAVTMARAVRAIRITGSWKPDEAGITFLRDRCPGSRVLIWFDWGEYALWHLSPTGTRVSMDGRRETVYSNRVITDHFAFYRGERASLDYPDRISANVVWLPAGFPSVKPLTERGWVTVFDSGRSVVLARRPIAAARAARHEEASGTFPGP